MLLSYFIQEVSDPEVMKCGKCSILQFNTTCDSSISSKIIINQNPFIPNRDLSVDEAVVKYKGCSSIKQYMPQKPVKRGFKIWMLADSDTGYVMKFSVYEGKTSNQVEKGLGANVVLMLSENFHCRYHHVYFDNFFMGRLDAQSAQKWYICL